MPLTHIDPQFWLALVEIIAIDLVLSGDNAIVIALACRNLSPALRRRGILYGVAGAVGLRVALTVAAAAVLGLPWLKLGGGLMLLWIGIRLLAERDDDEVAVRPAASFWGAVRTIVVADLVMSLDNVIGVAGAARGNLFLLLFGLIVSIPLIIWSSQALLRLMQRWPAVVTLGAATLGWVAGEMVWTDPALATALGPLPAWSGTVVAALAALFVVLVGKRLERRAAKAGSEEKERQP